MQDEIEMTPVESSQIHAIGYDHDTQRLAIQFKNKTGPSSLYHYENVPPEVHEEFIAAESKGRFFQKRIKPEGEKYPFTKIEPKAESESAPA